ncbi:hypothetical protein BpHYR1_016676 [Brachionus plicatilis]|uniref:Chitin-binding type-2 domain-containing protein n=1 Tax=Brachionus plicatilis TaxID=10195 RepID=A0A3M7P126_BRAPC|nr:hypothetical protein BpHYR1_016676 [Brachionus plicatilis]
MTCFGATASQDFWWKNNRIVRHEGIARNGIRLENLRPQFVPTLNEQTITGIYFDCSNKPTGPNKDNQYCDIYHACVFGKQQKTYVCAHNGEPFYYDENTQKCEFSSKNHSGCLSGNRWCNVYYRCFNKNKFEFLCAKMQSGGRLWWMEHSSSRYVSQSEAQCEWPCDTGRPCASPGGILIDDGSVRESPSEAQMVYDSCPKAKMRNPTSRKYAWSFLQVYGQKNTEKSDLYNSVSDDAKSGTISQTKLEYFFQNNSNDFNRMPDTENFCQGATDGTFVPNPLYCNLFHVCVKGFRKDFLCSKGSNSYDLWWNDATKQCEWPCKLKCDKKIFGSLNSAAEISAIDYSLNPVLCKINQKFNQL